ncbi:MAG: UDP-N-acetylmuramoyl-L-alanyl-D-glutamate--2,6-diaminopimelate ligase [Hydrogenophaga sp.]|jgi:UDP-N-acetylmuramoyl-L-alanyl-D-glutamate--2,6-diaminopimelate ligase|nr:UDP-N-acetylmuramoyl-L-alanyl-D-glutamate--2,6-diaminopimelate ligase [Hydrogenophaga sp.]
MRLFHDAQSTAQWLRRQVTGVLHCDSRQVRQGDGFVAWPGAARDGRQFVPSALEAGAAAVVVEHTGVDAFDLDTQAPIAAVPSLKALAGPIASAFCQNPSGQLDMVAITGTNGKTSSAWWVAQLLSACGRECGLVGTLGMGRVPRVGQGTDTPVLVPTGLTTPDPVRLQQRLRQFVDEGVQACAIEASSIGLVEGRLNGTRIRVAVFTNFTQDHLDFHGDMERYWAAKAMLFDWPGLQAAVVNLDDPKGIELAARLTDRPVDLWTVAVEPTEQSLPARLAATRLAFTTEGMGWTLVERDAQGQAVAELDMVLPMVGRYNVSNLLGVLAAARALGIPLEQATGACAALTPVPGRMQTVGVPTGVAGHGLPCVLVDYAHTPDALEKALRALQPLARQRGGALWVVVGCGGDRDRSKRPQMAGVAAREAAHVVFTSDNPRSEDPRRILQDMLAGLQDPERARVVTDRAEAIGQAVALAAPEDVVLVAGKGHEDYQEIQGVQRPFSDAAQVRAALMARLQQAAGGAV